MKMENINIDGIKKIDNSSEISKEEQFAIEEERLSRTKYDGGRCGLSELRQDSFSFHFCCYGIFYGSL